MPVWTHPTIAYPSLRFYNLGYTSYGWRARAYYLDTHERGFQTLNKFENGNFPSSNGKTGREPLRINHRVE